MQGVHTEEKWVPVNEILRFLYGHRHHLFEYFETKWSPSGQLTYGKVPSLLYNSIVMFAYNYQKQIWCIADDARVYNLCQDWSNFVYSKSAGFFDDSFLSRKDFFNMVKLLQTEEIGIHGISEIQLIRTFDPTTHDPLSQNSPPPEINSSPPLHSKRKLQPFDAIVSDKDHPKKGGDADPGAEVFTAERKGVGGPNRSAKQNPRIDRHDRPRKDHSRFSRKATIDAPRARSARSGGMGGQVRHKREVGQVSVSTKIDRTADEIVENKNESRSFCDALFAAGFDPYVQVTFAPFSRKGPAPHLNIVKKSNSVYNVKRACRWNASDANVMKFQVKIKQLTKCGLRFCIYDEEIGFGYLDARLGGAMIRVGEYITKVGEKKEDIELVLLRRKKFSGVLSVSLSAIPHKELPKDMCMLRVEVDTAKALKKDRNEGADFDGTSAAVSVVVFVGYLCVVGYIFKVLEADEAGGRIKTWSDGFWFSFITATTVGYGDYYPVTDIGLYVNCFVMLMDVIFLGYVMSLAFDYIVLMQERRSRIHNETGGLDDLNDHAFYEFLHKENTGKYWDSEQKRLEKQRRKKIKACDVGGKRVFVDGDFSEIGMEEFDVTAHIEKRGGSIAEELEEGVEVCIIEGEEKKIKTKVDGVMKESTLREEAKKIKDSQLWDAIDFQYWLENYREETWIEEKFQEHNQIILYSCITFGFAVVGCWIWIWWESMKFNEAIHFCFVSMSTVGYGDIAPITTEGKWFCAFYILIGVSVMSRLGSLLTESFVEKQSEKVTQKIADEMLMHHSQIEEMDIDGRGRVDRYEFMRGLLIAMNKAKNADFVGIRSRFLEIDISGDGKINKIDFDNMKERKEKEKRLKELAEATSRQTQLSVRQSDDELAFTPGSEPNIKTTE